MSRPKPKILFEFVNKEYKSEQVLESQAIYAVCYDDQPINLRTFDTINDDIGPKYKKCSFSNPGHAFNLAERLNNLFNTHSFAVHKMVLGPIINEND